MQSYAIRTVLVPIDFSPLSANALHTAIAISKRQLATMTLIHVVEDFQLQYPHESGGAKSTLLSQMLKESTEQLSRIARESRLKHDVVINHIIQVGNPADEICRWALQKEYDLIVMATHGVSGWREFFIGSIAYRVVRNAPCPVMTIPGTSQWSDFRKILFPIRLVPQVLDKYDYLRAIIRKNNSSLRIAGMMNKSEFHDLFEMKNLLESIQYKTEKDSVTTVTEIVQCDHVAREVLNIAKQERPDLIVITATPDSSIKDFFFGTYTQDIVNHANVPVLSIRPPYSDNTLNGL